MSDQIESFGESVLREALVATGVDEKEWHIMTKDEFMQLIEAVNDINKGGEA